MQAGLLCHLLLLFNLGDKLLCLTALLEYNIAHAQIGQHDRLCFQKIPHEVEVSQQTFILLNCIIVALLSLHVDRVGQVGPEYLRFLTDVVGRF